MVRDATEKKKRAKKYEQAIRRKKSLSWYKNNKRYLEKRRAE